MSPDPLVQKSAIFAQFLRGEIDATTAVRRIRALPWTSPALEFASVGEVGSPADEATLKKLNRFLAVWRAVDKGPAA